MQWSLLLGGWVLCFLAVPLVLFLRRLRHQWTTGEMRYGDKQTTMKMTGSVYFFFSSSLLLFFSSSLFVSSCLWIHLLAYPRIFSRVIYSLSSVHESMYLSLGLGSGLGFDSCTHPLRQSQNSFPSLLSRQQSDTGRSVISTSIQKVRSTADKLARKGLHLFLFCSVLFCSVYSPSLLCSMHLEEHISLVAWLLISTEHSCWFSLVLTGCHHSIDLKEYFAFINSL